MEHILSKIGSQKVIIIIVSILGLVSSIYGYYELLSIVPVFADIFGAFETNLSTTSQFIIQTHTYYGGFSIIGLLALLFTLFNKINFSKAYLLIVNNLLLMFSIRWLTANELNQSILTMGVIQ
jgi:glucan phosphoethanolaminetransferase (alkaline phosphatase superfamily)